jgi:hypothetical protein
MHVQMQVQMQVQMHRLFVCLWIYLFICTEAHSAVIGSEAVFFRV